MTLNEIIQVAEIVLEYISVIAWPLVVVIVVCMFRKHIISLLKRLKDADLPGGVRINLLETIQETEKLSDEVREQKPPPEKRAIATIPITEANARMLKLGLQPSPSGVQLDHYRLLAEQDPNLALAGLRMELEILTKNLAKGYALNIGDRVSLREVVRKLHDNHSITNEQRRLIENIAAVCNAAMHGEPVSRNEAEQVIESAGALAEQYISWLSWGFNDS